MAQRVIYETREEANRRRNQGLAWVIAIILVIVAVLISVVVGLLTVGISFVLSPGILITSFLSKLFETGMALKWILSISFSIGLFFILKKVVGEKKIGVYLTICSVLFFLTAAMFLISPGSGYEKKVVRPTLAGMFRFVNFTPIAKWVTVWPVFKVFYNVSDDATFNGEFISNLFSTVPPDGIDAINKDNNKIAEEMSPEKMNVDNNSNPKEIQSESSGATSDNRINSEDAVETEKETEANAPLDQYVLLTNESITALEALATTLDTAGTAQEIASAIDKFVESKKYVDSEWEKTKLIHPDYNIDNETSEEWNALKIKFEEISKQVSSVMESKVTPYLSDPTVAASIQRMNGENEN